MKPVLVSAKPVTAWQQELEHESLRLCEAKAEALRQRVQALQANLEQGIELLAAALKADDDFVASLMGVGSDNPQMRTYTVTRDFGRSLRKAVEIARFALSDGNTTRPSQTMLTPFEFRQSHQHNLMHKTSEYTQVACEAAGARRS